MARGVSRTSSTKRMPFDSGQADEQYLSFYLRVANGDHEAANFLCNFHRWCHNVDDIIDESRWSPLLINKVLLEACQIYSHPFYRRHCAALQSQIIIATSAYADANKWEKDGQLWKRQWAEVLRHAGLHVNFTVAMICGGWEHLRAYSAPQLAMAFIYHKDRHGTPT